MSTATISSDETAQKDVMGIVIAYTLLLLYVGTIGYMLARVVSCGRASKCPADLFKTPMLTIVTTIGGLVSALVVARLTVAKRGSTAFSIAGVSTADGGASGILAWAYLIGWFAMGLLALIVGSLVYPDANRTVTDLGTAWLGIAVAAGYAYFNIDPHNP